MSGSKSTESIKDAPRYLDASQVARMLGLSVKRVYDQAEELGGVRMGFQWRFPVNRLPGQPDSTWVAPKLGRPSKR